MTLTLAVGHAGSMDAEKILNEKKELELKVKKLEEQISRLLAPRNHIEDALAPPRKEINGKDNVWKEERDWPVEERKKILESLDFDPFQFEHEDHKLLILSYDMFESFGLLQKFNIPKQTMREFLLMLKFRFVP